MCEKFLKKEHELKLRPIATKAWAYSIYKETGKERKNAQFPHNKASNYPVICSDLARQIYQGSKKFPDQRSVGPHLQVSHPLPPPLQAAFTPKPQELGTMFTHPHVSRVK